MGGWVGGIWRAAVMTVVSPSQLWDSSTGMVLADFKGHRDMVTCCALSASGKIIVSSSEDLTVKVRA